MIYHISDTKGFQRLMATSRYLPEFFAQDGFVHCSFKEQIIRTANRFFTSQDHLLLFEIDETTLINLLGIENLEDGNELFPHIYGSIPIESITKIAFFDKTKNGFEFPSIWYSPLNISNMVK